jgi:CYTH domain-containing protein
VARRSHRAPIEPGWRFDEYLDRRLVLAVAEGESPAPQAAPPTWLEPLVVREVTGERGYTDEALARRPPRRG